MAYLNPVVIEKSINTLVDIGFNTNDTSSLVYYFALSRCLKFNNSNSIDFQSPQAREQFIGYCSELFSINDNEGLIWHPFLKADNGVGWNKGKTTESLIKSNFLSTVVHRKESSYPKRNPLLDFSSGSARLHDDHKKNIKSILDEYAAECVSSLMVILARSHCFLSDSVDSNQLAKAIEDKYGFDFNYIGYKNEAYDSNNDEMVETYQIIMNRYKKKTIEGDTTRVRAIVRHTDSLVALPRSFLLLAGISGTGKSRFVRKQARGKDFFCSVAVRPDWHEPSDLLGYISRINKEKYIVADALKFMVSAWCDACDLNNTSEKVLINKAPSEMNTFWLCLDEMNLAPVEQYFADYLSVIETRKWDVDSYSCDPILKADVIKLLSPEARDNLRGELGLTTPEYDSLWSYFSEIGIPIPPNLIVAGTVNMDETTHGFSRKVIDRALTLDFGQFFPNDFDEFFEAKSTPVKFSFPTISQATEFDFNDVPADSKGKESLEFLKRINTILKGTMFELAYRALNELFISVICIKPKNEVELQAVWDDFLMTKVLPRIEGDDDKLQNPNDSNTDILKTLDLYIKENLANIYDGKNRPDFFRIDNASNEPVKIECRSRIKLQWMSDRLKTNRFTTFWP